MKTRNVFAGAVVGALALGIWLGSFWKGPGRGGLGTGFGTSNQAKEAASPEDTRVDLSQTSAESVAPETKPRFEDFPTDLMTIVINGDQYRLVDEAAPAKGMVLTLPEVIERSKAMTGTPEGIRVRILKGKTAQEGARADLMKFLTESGVKREEIQERAEFVD